MWLEVSGQDRSTVGHLISSSVQQHVVNMTSANNTSQQTPTSQRINFQFQWENTFWRDANFEKEDIDY